MKDLTIKYWVEVKEDQNFKIVAYNEKNEFMFLVKKQAISFKRKQERFNPDKQFRLVTCRTEYFRTPWSNIKK